MCNHTSGVMAKETAQAFYVKIRERGKRTWYFITPRGTMNRVIVHASEFPSVIAASCVASDLERDNPRYETKVVDWNGKDQNWTK